MAKRDTPDPLEKDARLKRIIDTGLDAIKPALKDLKGLFHPEENESRAKNLMTVEEVVELLGRRVTPAAIRKQLRLGQLKGRKIGKRWYVYRSQFKAQ